MYCVRRSETSGGLVLPVSILYLPVIYHCFPGFSGPDAQNPVSLTYNSRNTIIYSVYLWAGAPAFLPLPVGYRWIAGAKGPFFPKQKILLRIAELCSKVYFRNYCEVVFYPTLEKMAVAIA